VGFCLTQKGNIMNIAIVDSKSFSFAGIRQSKKDASELVRQAERNKQREELKQLEIETGIIRNRNIPDNTLNFTALKTELALGIKNAKKESRTLAWELKREDPTTHYSVDRSPDIYIIFFDRNGRNEYFTSYIEIDPNNITAKDIEKIKNDFVSYLKNNPQNFVGEAGIDFDGRVDVNYKTKDGYEDYEIGNYIDPPTIWNTTTGWVYSK
jgi:hypothetical protein